MEVKREVVLPAARDEVWAALTEAERLEEWFANEVELDVRPGGSGVFRWGDGSVREAIVEEVDPERRLGFRWREADGEEGETLASRRRPATRHRGPSTFERTQKLSALTTSPPLREVICW